MNQEATKEALPLKKKEGGTRYEHPEQKPRNAAVAAAAAAASAAAAVLKTAVAASAAAGGNSRTEISTTTQHMTQAKTKLPLLVSSHC